MNEELWKPDDKEWMAQRKEEWPKIVKSLDAIGYIKRKHYKYHKDYFFKGPSSIDEDLVPSKVFGGGRLIFKMWYLPVATLEAYKNIFLACPSAGAQEALFRFHSSALNIEDQTYGLMGGREELIIKAIYPSFNYDDVACCVRHGIPQREAHLAPVPLICLTYVLNAFLSMFLRPNKNPFSPGQYLVDHLDHCIDKIDLDDSDLARKRERLINAMHVIKYQSKHPKFQKDNMLIVEVANKLKSRFENRDFGATLMNYWDNIDELYKENLD